MPVLQRSFDTSVSLKEPILHDTPWYRPTLSSSAISTFLQSKPNGTFLIKNGSTHGVHILHYAYEGQVLAVRIDGEQVFGTVSSCRIHNSEATFSSLVELVQFYREKTNHDIECPLVIPELRGRTTSLNSALSGVVLNFSVKSLPATFLYFLFLF